MSKSPKSPDRGNDKKAHGKPASASASANLLATFHVLDAEQIPLLSLGVMEQAAGGGGVPRPEHLLGNQHRHPGPQVPQ